MDPGLGAYGLALIAGLLSILSPCVLPILPILLGSASAAHPRAPLALALGLALSYAIIGTAIAWLGTSMGLDASTFRNAGAVMMGLIGLVLLSANLQQRFAHATAGIGNAGNALLTRVDASGLKGQFVIGLTLGVVWSPCAGPALGAAIVVASQGKHLLQTALVMAAFGLGAALPVIGIARASHAALSRVRGRALRAGQFGKLALGVVMMGISLLILTGMDRPIENWLLDVSPAWMTELTTRF